MLREALDFSSTYTVQKLLVYTQTLRTVTLGAWMRRVPRISRFSITAPLWVTVMSPWWTWRALGSERPAQEAALAGGAVTTPRPATRESSRVATRTCFFWGIGASPLLGADTESASLTHEVGIRISRL